MYYHHLHSSLLYPSLDLFIKKHVFLLFILLNYHIDCNKWTWNFKTSWSVCSCHVKSLQRIRRFCPVNWRNADAEIIVNEQTRFPESCDVFLSRTEWDRVPLEYQGKFEYSLDVCQLPWILSFLFRLYILSHYSK